MNKICIVLITCLICCSLITDAQEKLFPVKFPNGDFLTGNNIEKGIFSKSMLQSALSGSKYYALLQFSKIPSTEIKKQMAAAGIELHEYIPYNAYFSTITSNFDFSVAGKFGIISVNSIPAIYKSDVVSDNYIAKNEKDVKSVFAVTYFPSVEKKVLSDALQAAGAVIIPSKYNFKNSILVKSDKRALSGLLKIPFVIFISEQVITDRPINYNDISTHGISSLQSPLGRNLDGKNVVVGVGDNADINTHIDFNGKVISRQPYPYDNHGTHTSGTTAGAGFLNPRNKGMAPAAHIVSQWFSDVIVNTAIYFSDYRMIATNNSYYSANMGCSGNRMYNVLSNYIDGQMINYDEVLHVMAAGNDGSQTCSGFPSFFGTVKSGWQTAKNVITVGAMDQANYAIASFSSRGPAQDGRIKPEIVTNGFATVSTYPNNTYATNFGTSMAAPVITGATALIQQRYRQLNAGNNAKAALVKALLCNTAEDLGNPGPDYTYGFGMLNARKTVEALEGNRYFSGTISGTQEDTYSIVVPPGIRRLKVMLCWSDFPAVANAAFSLVNDLDLTVRDPAAQLRLPLVLNPLIVSANATEGPDHLNNTEQVVIENPVAGTYNLYVKGFAVPQGPQSYFLTYQMDMNGITVEYPFGGETLVPGQTEKIRWTAYGNESNNFSIEYSDNNGSSWNPAGTGSAAGSVRFINWTVPSVPGNNYRVRVSRDGTSYTDMSDFSFMVLQQPVITPSVPVIPCEGFVQLDWPVIPGATSYEIFQLQADSMAVIATTTANSYLISGLKSNVQYWFAVGAKNATTKGRRSLAVKATASGGSCSLSLFDGNFKAVSIDAPVSGRVFTSTALQSAEQVKLSIKNLDNVSSTGAFTLSYQVNGGAVITENASISIPSLGTYTHSFMATAAFGSTGVYSIKAWVSKPGDGFAVDDTVASIVKNLGNPLLVLPVSDGFETTTIAEYNANTTGLEGNDRTDFKTVSSRGRARTFVNTGFALTGNRAITLDQSPYGSLVTDSLLMTWNLNNYVSGKQLRIDFNYKNHGQASNPDNKVWIRAADTLPWVFAYNLVDNQAALGKWKLGLINVNEVLDTILPIQRASSSFQIKIAQQGNTSANVPDPLLDQDDGYTIDDVSITEAIGDLGITSVVAPSFDGCGLTGSNPVSFKVKNYTSSAVNNVQASYRFNSGAVVTETIPVINPGQSLQYTFATTANLSGYTDYDFDFWITAAGDNYPSNDSVLNFSVHNSPVINSYPYLEGFELNNGNWYTKGTNATWEWGSPSNNVISKAANGSKAWVTGLADNYSDNELSYLYSPCFNLTGMVQPVLSFSHIFEIEQDYDYTWVEYSTDGKSWKKLGTAGSGTNWYDNAGADNWRLSDKKWHVASVNLPVLSGTLRLRFVLSSDAGLNYEGVGIDDVHIFDKAPVYIGATATDITQTVSGNTWVHFMLGTNRVASIHPNGQNLGLTGVDVYPFAGQVRTANGQYYLNRNIVIKSAFAPTANVGVRVYFTDAEAKALLAGNSCAACIKPADPYELGITKYTGNAFDENGDLEDDLSGYFNFIPPGNTEIIPYDNGYYAEFSISDFSECWLSNGLIKPAASSICAGTVFSFSASSTGASYQWQEDSGSGFENIFDGINYSGTETGTLQLTGIPTSFTGNKYRCVVNGIDGIETILRFTNFWNGTVGTDWMNAANWSCNMVPDEYTDVVIPGGLINKPELNQITAIRTIRVFPGAQVVIKTGVILDIKGR